MVCKHCKRMSQHSNHDKDKSLSGMIQHLAACLPYKRVQRDRLGNQPDILLSFTDGSTTKLPTRGLMMADTLIEQVLRIITSANLPFHFTDNPEFITLLKNAYLHCLLLNHHSVAECLQRMAKEAKDTLKEELESLDSKVSLAIDAWSSHGHVGFLGNNPYSM